MQIVVSMEFKSAEEKNHVCSFCGKEFSSGKALGGHKRFHIQQERQAAAAAAAAGNKAQESGNNISIRSKIQSDRSMLCFICHKYFPSMKSLSGHMRTHRDRNWKGIQPPRDLENQVSDRFTSGSPSSDSTTVVDLLQSLSSSWPETGKRGRKGDSTLAAAVDLINLSRSQDWVLEKRPEVKAVSSPTSVSGDGTDYDSDPEKYVRVCDLKKRKNMMMKNSVSVSSSSNSTETDNNGNKDGKSVSINNMRIRFSTHKTSAAATYKCSSCDKSFSTFQALGGHRSTHNKENKRNSSAATIDTKKKDDGVEVRKATMMNFKRTKIYGEGVGIAQSCGGGELQMASSSSSQVNRDHHGGGGNCSATGRRLGLDIDLNQMPCAVMADDVTDA